MYSAIKDVANPETENTDFHIDMLLRVLVLVDL
jgi:hypothetical protein